MKTLRVCVWPDTGHDIEFKRKIGNQIFAVCQSTPALADVSEIELISESDLAYLRPDELFAYAITGRPDDDILEVMTESLDDPRLVAVFQISADDGSIRNVATGNYIATFVKKHSAAAFGVQRDPCLM